jgi:ribonuclease Z
MSARDLIILGCSSQQPTRSRNHGAYLLRWNTEGFLFDPGDGTQRQFIFANVAPTCITRIFVSHFHGDHCLGVGSMLMRLNLDKVTHPIHCYYPASGQKYFQRLRFGTIYHQTVKVVEHPIEKAGLVEDDGNFRIECDWLDHGVDALAWRVTESDRRRFDRTKLEAAGVFGPMVRQLEQQGYLIVDGQRVELDQVSWVQKGESIAVVLDTRPCRAALDIARGARLLLCESTYLEEHAELAKSHQHMTARDAALIAREAGVDQLILTHFSARYGDLSRFAEEARPIFANTDVAEDLKVFLLPRTQKK